MAKTFWLQTSGLLSSANYGETKYYSPGNGNLSWSSGWSSSDVEITPKTAGTWSNLYIRVIINTLNSITQVRTLDNGSTGNQVVNVGSSSTGEFSDSSNTDTISVDDEQCISLTCSGTSGSISFTMIGSAFDASSDTMTRFVRVNDQSLSKNTTYYWNLSGGETTTSTTEANAQIDFESAGTLKNLYVWRNTGNSPVTVVSRINGADGNLTISSSSTGTFSDVTHSDSISAGDLVCWSVAIGGTGGGATVPRISAEYITTSGEFVIAAGSENTKYFASNGYPPAAGQLGQNFATTESYYRYSVPFAVDVSNLWCKVPSGSSGTGTLYVRKNGASSSNLSISISGTGEFTDLTGSDSYSSGDDLNFYYNVGTGSTYFTGISLTAAEPSAAQTGKITAVQANLTYSLKTGKITATQGDITYSLKTGRITATQGDLTYSERGGRITATQGDITYSEKTGRITATQADLTYSEKTGRITATQGDLTYTEKTGKITATQADLTYTARGARVTATQADITYTLLKTGKITATQADLTYTEKTARVTATQADVTYQAKTARITATQGDLTYTEKTGRVTATQADVTYSEKTARVTATQADLTYSERGARVTATQADITYSTVQSGRITAVQGDITYTTKTARITATQGDITYSEKTGKITAVQSDLTYSERGARITAVQGDITYTGTTARITATQADLTYSERTARITAVQGDLVYTARGARITAAQADITYTGGSTAKITATQADLTYTVKTGRISAVEADAEYSTTAGQSARITATQADLVLSEKTGRISAAQADITYSATAGQIARITAVQAVLTHSIEGVERTFRKVNKFTY